MVILNLDVHLTQNEKKTLKLLVGNSKMTDCEIALKLKITSQAVGKIRKKLENQVITEYTVKVDYSRLGIKIFTVALAKITPEGRVIGIDKVEEKLVSIPQAVNVYRTSRGSSTHIVLFAFKSLLDHDYFFNSEKWQEDLHQYIETLDLHTFHCGGFVKNDPSQIIRQVVSGEDTPPVLLK